MRENTIKGRLSEFSAEIMAAILIIQPFLDVLSYFMQKTNMNYLTTGLRMVLLVVVSIYGFIISDRKKSYALIYMVMAAFWIIHAANCFRMGYQDMMLDIAEYFKLIQMPLWTMSFISMFKKRDGLNVNAVGLLALNFLLILAIIGLSYLTGTAAYTYDYPDRGIQIGILGWFGVANTQSAIVSVLVAPLLLWAYRKERLWLFCLSCAAGFGLLYFTGTRFAYFAGIIIAAALIVFIFITQENHKYCIPLVACIILFLSLQGFSPMTERRQMASDTHAEYQEQTDNIMDQDKNFVHNKNEEIPEATLAKIERVYSEVYGVEGALGNTLLGDLIDRFGVDAVMRKYDYTLDADILYDVRVKRLNYCALVMESKDAMTKLFGFEYAETYYGDNNIYDPENDFPALLYFYGYVGTTLYAVFILYFILIALRELIQDFHGFYSIEAAVAALMAVLILAAAQFSGQVLRKPSIEVYLSFALALIYSFVNKPVMEKFSSIKKKSIVSIKKL